MYRSQRFRSGKIKRPSSRNRICDFVRSLSYVVSIHAAEVLDDDNLTILDLESVPLRGQITERRRDRRTRAIKAVVRGRILERFAAAAIVKLGEASTPLVITIYFV